jgi:hypothetical protein
MNHARQRDHRQQSETGRLEQLPNRKTKISRRKKRQLVTVVIFLTI